MVQMLVSYWRDGAYYVKGGMQQLCEELARELVSRGGKIAFGQSVRRVLFEDQVACGVELHRGRLLFSRAIVLACDPRQFMGSFPTRCGWKHYRRRLLSMSLSAALFVFYLGLRRGFEAKGLARGFYHLDGYGGGRWLYVSSPSQMDSSAAPPGKVSLQVVASLGEGVSKQAGLVEEVVGILDGFAAGLRKSVEFALCAHPGLRSSSNFLSFPYGWAVLPEQAGPRRLENKTPAPNLFLAGQWTAPGPGVCAASASGWRSAKEVARWLRGA
jgi:phytoene dehydrogenase-like protein